MLVTFKEETNFTINTQTIAQGYEDAQERYEEECERQASGQTLEELQGEVYEDIPDYWITILGRYGRGS